MKPRPPDDDELVAIRAEAMDFAKIGVYRYTFDGRVVFMDRGTLTLLDLEDAYPDESDLIGQRIADLIEYIEPPGRLRREVRERGKAFDFEYHYRTLSGQERWVYHSAHTVFDASAGEEVIQVIARDITDLKLTARELERSEQRYRDLAESTSHGLVAIGRRSAQVLFVNQALARITGLPLARLEAMNGEDLLALVHGDDRDLLRRRFEAAATASSAAGPFDLRVGRPDGSQRWITVDLAVIELGGEPAVQAVVLDATDRKLEEARLKTLEARLESAQRLESLGVLAGGIAHDFNNLLVAVMGNAEIALVTGANGDRGQAVLGAIIDAAERGAGLCAQLLAYAGRHDTSFETLDLNELIEETHRLLTVSVPKKVEVTVELEPDLPTVRGNRSQLVQVLMNLIANGAEAIGDHPGSVRIRSSVERCDRPSLDSCILGPDAAAGDFVSLEVADTGAGMDAATLDRIFDPFFTTKFIGSGLGLASTLGIIKGHGGAIDVSSTVGEGTRFTLLLPVVHSKGAPLTPEEGDAAAIGGTVLVVDDEAPVRESLLRLLRSVDIDAVAAASGREALEILNRPTNGVAMILLDMMMPELDGLEVFELVRAADPALPVVFMSGHSERHFAAEVSRFRGVTFLAKPFRRDTLLRALGEVARWRPSTAPSS